MFGRLGSQFGRGGSASGSVEPRISLDGTSVSENAAVGIDVGILHVVGGIGTPVFTLDDDAGGKYVLDGDILEVADALSAGTDSITVSVTGITPQPPPVTFAITVAEAGVGGLTYWAPRFYAPRYFAQRYFG